MSFLFEKCSYESYFLFLPLPPLPKSLLVESHLVSRHQSGARKRILCCCCFSIQAQRELLGMVKIAHLTSHLQIHSMMCPICFWGKVFSLCMYLEVFKMLRNNVENVIMYNNLLRGSCLRLSYMPT